MLGWIFISFEQYLCGLLAANDGGDDGNLDLIISSSLSAPPLVSPPSAESLQAATHLPPTNATETTKTEGKNIANESFLKWDSIMNEFWRLRGGVDRGSHSEETKWTINEKYCDDEFYDLVAASVIITNLPPEELLEGLGRYILSSSR
jgi:hypothetical protein